MKKGLLGKKVGMLGLWSESGEYIAVSVVHAEPGYVAQVKTKEKDGYEAVQVAFDSVPAQKTAKVNKPSMGHQKKLNEKVSTYFKNFLELRDYSEAKEVGMPVSVSTFSRGEKVFVRGTSKGKGFQGVMKRYNFHGGKASHGSTVHRVPGAIGAGTDPSEVMKGKKMPGRMGGKKVTVTNVEVYDVIPDDNLVLIRGSIPGANGSSVFLYQN